MDSNLIDFEREKQAEPNEPKGEIKAEIGQGERKEAESNPNYDPVHNRLEVIGLQKGLFGAKDKEMLGEFELNRVYCGDCMELMKKIPDNSVDLVITDPPYNTGMTSKIQEGKTYFKTKKPRLFGFFNDFYLDEDYLNLVNNVCKEIFRVLKQNKGIYIYMNWKKLGLWIQELEKVGFRVKNVIVWDKVVHGLNYQNYAHTYELIIFAVKGNFYPNNKNIIDRQKGFFKDVWNVQRKINNIQKEGHHETEKLIDIVKIPISHSSNLKDIVLDPFIGSGTTLVACKQLNRKFIGFEINSKYVDIVKRRLSQETLLQKGGLNSSQP